MKTKKTLLNQILFLSLQLCFSTISWAQIKDTSSNIFEEQTLSSVVVTGQYKPTKPEDAVQRVRIIDSKKIAAMGAQNLRDVLLNEMNLTIAQDNVLGSSLSIQGVSGQNVKILVDGVPVIGRQNGNVDIAQLNVYNVERIELVEGPMSVNYGTDALAGTINIITKSSLKSNLEAAVNTYTETIGKYNVNASAGFRKSKHTFLISGARNFFDGWDAKEGMNFFKFAPELADERRSLQWDAKEEYNANMQYSYRFNKSTFRLKSDYFYDLITNRGAPNGYYGYTAFDDYYKTQRFNNALFANGKFFKNKTYSFIAAYNLYKRIKNTYEKDLTTLNNVMAAASDQDTSGYSLFNTRGTISNSYTASRINYEMGYDVNLEKGSGKRILDRQQQIADFALYGSAEYKITDSFIIRGGLRYAYNTSFRAPLIPSVNIKYTLMKGLTIRSSYAHGFRAPSVKELYFEFKDSNHDIIGNPKLKPEESDNYNIAITYSNGINGLNYKLEFSGFYNSINDMINLAQPDTNALRFTYVNIDKFKTKGVQLNYTSEYKNLKFSLGGSYIGRYNQLSGSENAIVNTFSYSPEMRCNTAYEWPKCNLSLSLFLKYTGSMPSYGLGTNNEIVLTTIDAYSMADLSISKRLFKSRMILTLGCKNLFNTINVNRVGESRATAHSTTNNSLSISTGRSLFFGLGYQFPRK
jgi:outer membrane receptor for ferrienterochelin and colicins